MTADDLNCYAVAGRALSDIKMHYVYAIKITYTPPSVCVARGSDCILCVPRIII